MKTWVRKSLKVGILSAGILLVAGNAANAADSWNTSGNFGIANGNQAKAVVQAPVDVSGNAIGVLGFAQAQSVGGSSAILPGDALEDSWNTWGNFGIGNGNQAKVVAQAPINVSGNAVAVGGAAAARSVGGSWATISRKSEAGTTGHGRSKVAGAKTEAGYAPRTEADWITTGNFGIGNGNQAYAPIQIPIDVCGNAIAVLGSAQAGCKGGSNAALSRTHDSWYSSGNFGILNGNQAKLPIQIPIDICGNAIAVLGSSQAGCQGGSTATLDEGKGDAHGDGGYGKPGTMNHGTMNHGKNTHGRVTQDKYGNDKPCEAASGESTASNGSRRDAGKPADWNTSGNFGIGNGNQVRALLQAPIEVSGNALSVLGGAAAWSVGGATAVH